MTISSKLPPPLKKEGGKQPPKPGSFSKLLEKKQNKLLEKEDKKSPENPIWAPNQMLTPEIKQPGLSDILSTKLSELEPTMATSTTELPIEIEELWEKLASATLLTYNSQDQETTFILKINAPSFSGMRVTIKEFSTAPKIFNIELAPNSSSALSLIASHVQQLLDRFKCNREEFGFSVHQITAELQPHETTNYQEQAADEDDQ
ncbi:MAG: hypothetical protein ACRDAI_04105 [Candidatus Rhabdochlamydia sp.]